MRELIEKVREEYGVEIKDENDMTSAWRLVEILKDKGWVVYVITAKGREQVDAWHPSYGSLYAQFGEIPLFRSIVEGICVTALHVRELEKDGTL